MSWGYIRRMGRTQVDLRAQRVIGLVHADDEALELITKLVTLLADKPARQRTRREPTSDT